MFLQSDTQTDPIVEILRLAYRRGLAIRQEKERSESIDSGGLVRNEPSEVEPTDALDRAQAQAVKTGEILS